MRPTLTDRVRDLAHRLRTTDLLRGRPKEVPVSYEKYRNLLNSFRGKCEVVGFSERDPRAGLVLPEGVKNLYYIQFILGGDAVEDSGSGSLFLRSDILAQVHDEFERNEAIKRFDEARVSQQDLLAKKMFYVERDVPLPEFDFESKSFDLSIPGLVTNRSIALHDVQFIYDFNLTDFSPRFRFHFADSDQARAWKRQAAGMRLGIVFHVVTTTDNLWQTGMPGTVLYVVGFAFVQGATGRVVADVPVEVFGLRGPHDLQPRGRPQIKDAVTRLLERP